MNYPEITELFGRNSFRKYIRTNYPDFYQYIENKYSSNLSFPEKLYWYYHDIDKHPLCPQCGKLLKFKSLFQGYQQFCSYKCSANSREKIERCKKTCEVKYGGIGFASRQLSKKCRDTLLSKYGVITPLANKNIHEKKMNTTRLRYGRNHRLQDPEYSDIIHAKMRDSIESKYGPNGIFGNPSIRQKIIDTFNDRYGVDNPMKCDVVKKKLSQTCLERYGTINPMCKQEFVDKMFDTKKTNKTCSSSSTEVQFQNYLISENIDYISQYKSKQYPFHCDFYIIQYDLYIEIQGSWVHGDHPYNDDSDKCIVEKWNDKVNSGHPAYKNAIITWTVKDPIKRTVAKNNNLNFIEIFSSDPSVVIATVNKYINENLTGYYYI